MCGRAAAVMPSGKATDAQMHGHERVTERRQKPAGAELTPNLRFEFPVIAGKPEKDAL
jgi:hypothetical protein